jgi:DNA-binding MarR family transcriptional regulator
MRESEPENSIMSQNSCRAIFWSLVHGDGVTQLELAEATRLKPPTVSVALKRMEEEGYVRREPDPMDMRAVRVFLTEEGRKLDEEHRMRIHSIDEITMQNISDEDAEYLRKLLIQMRDNLTRERETKK